MVEEVSFGEVERALRKMKVGKSVGPDGIPMEVWKIVGDKAITWLQRLFNKMLSREGGDAARVEGELGSTTIKDMRINKEKTEHIWRADERMSRMEWVESDCKMFC